MIIKVCGIADPNNLVEISRLGLDMIGFNFYPMSKRYIGQNSGICERQIKQKKIAVFVNCPLEDILELQQKYRFDYAQLHGDESVDICRRVQSILPIIKVFRVDENFSFGITKDFEFADLFLFDTKVKEYGGSGEKFRWDVLQNYTEKTPFLLSGGIGPEDGIQLKKFNHPAWIGVDINSCFEEKPGFKNLELVRQFLSDMGKYQFSKPE